MDTHHLLFLAAAYLLAPSTSASPQVVGGMARLPNLGGEQARASDVSAAGTFVVGWSQLPFQLPVEACVWGPGEFTHFQSPIGASIEARAVSGNGLVVGGNYVSAGLNPGFVWSASAGVTTISAPSSSATTVLGLSADGAVAIGFFQAPGLTRAFRWTAASGVVDLGTFGGLGAVAQAITPDGLQIVGSSQDSFGTWRPFRWTAATGMVLLPTPATPAPFWPRAVSADGAVVVGYTWPGGDQYRAQLWTAPDQLLDLGTLGGSWARAVDVSADGSVVVGTSTNASGAQRAFRWTAATGMQDIGTLDGGWSEAFGVSADGDVIVGQANTTAQTIVAFRWERGVDAPLGTAGCPPTPNSAGPGSRLTASGSNLPAANRVSLQADRLPPFSIGYFLASPTGGFQPNVPGSQGTLCLGGPIGRYVGPGQVLGASADGTFSLALDLTALAQPTGATSYVPGTTWHFQAWYRDANPAPSSNFSASLLLRLN